MANNSQTQIAKDVQARKINVTRKFNAAPDLVWKAWTESELLDQWWAPRPWRAETKTLKFIDGGHWLYAMTGPDGTKIWSIVEFHSIKKHQSFKATSFFCDEKGEKKTDFPSLNWTNVFLPDGKGTRMEVEIYFDKETDLHKIVEMGFEGGFSMALGNLDELLENLI